VVAEANPGAPAADCSLCERLAAFRHANQRKEPTWHNAPVPSFGNLDARLLIVGLAPGMRGANRTSRPFTGDFAGDLLYATLLKFGFAEGAYAARADDGLKLVDCRVTNAVRCVPPQNKPTTTEITACRPFLAAELSQMVNLRVVLTLGTIAHASYLRTIGAKASAYRFGHGAVHVMEDGPLVVDSYHCSRLNTNTGRLTPAMFEQVFAKIRGLLD
jgi:uracil-DNA glycosylase family 4